MATAIPTELAEALAAATPADRRAILEEADRLRRTRCCAPGDLGALLDSGVAARAAAVAKALADPVRVQLLDAIRQRDEVCQCDLHPLFDLSQPTISHHLRKLADAGLIRVERRGRWAYYSTDHDALKELKAWLS